MNYLFCDSKLNMKLISIFILIGLSIGLYFNSSLFIIILDFWLRENFNLHRYYYILSSGAIIGILLALLIPERKNRINEFSGISNRLFNNIDYIIAVFTGYLICFSFYAIIGIIYYVTAKYFHPTAYKALHLETLIFIFGLLHGFFCKALIDNKIFEFESEFTTIQKISILAIFILFYCCFSQYGAMFMYKSFEFYGNKMYNFFIYLNLTKYLDDYRYYYYLLPFNTH